MKAESIHAYMYIYKAHIEIHKYCTRRHIRICLQLLASPFR